MIIIRKIIIIIILLLYYNNKKRKKNQSNGGREASRGERERLRELIFFILFFVSFSDLRKSDRRFSSGLKAKLIYAMRATRGHQKVGVSTNSVRYGFYPT